MVIAPLSVVAAALVQFAPVLRGRVYRFEDIAAYFEPLWTAAARAMREGRLPLWDGGAWSGQPLVGDPQTGIFYPPNWLWLALPVLRAYALMVLLHAAWAGLGMYVLCRVRGRTPGAAALGGIALAIGGYVVLQTRHVMFVETTAWVPWVAAAALSYLDAPRARMLAAAALAAGMMLLTGGESMIYYAAWFLLAVCLPAALSPVRGAPRERLRSLAGLALAAILGLLLAAPSVLPAALHGGLSPRALGADEAFSASVAWSGFQFIPSLFIPNLLGQEVRGDYWGGGTQWEIAGYYCGVLSFALALGALLFGPRGRRTERIALASIFILAVLLSPGLASPIHRLACRVLPLYGAMRCPPRALYVFSLGIPMLAADGLDLVVLPRLRFALRRAVVVLLPLVVAADLLYAHRAENPSLPLAEAERAGHPEAAAFIQRHPGERYINDVHLPHALHNSGLLWGAENASGYSSLPLWRYLHYLWIANHRAPYPHARLHDDLAAQGIWRMDSPLLDALDVRWVLSKRPPVGQGFVLRMSSSDGIDVWENTEAMPRARFLRAVHVVASAVEAAQALAVADFDPARETILEETPDPMPAPTAPTPDRVEHAEVSMAGRGEVVVELSAPSLLVLSEPFHPERHASIDDAPAHLLVADYALTGIALPAGHHVVRFWMRARGVELGLALAALSASSILILFLWALAASGNRRR